MRRILAPLILLALVGLLVLPGPRRSDSQGIDVYLNVIAGGSKKLIIAIPTFTRTTASADPADFARRLPEIVGADLTFSALFGVVNPDISLPASDQAATKKVLADLAAAGAHAALQGTLREVREDRVTVEVRLYDLTGPEQRSIMDKSFWAPARDHRQLAHRIADEVVFQFTGERGIAETKIAYISRETGTKEVYVMDYDGFNRGRLTDLRSITLSPVWNPRDLSIALTSYYQGYPFLYRVWPFDRRVSAPEILAAWPGINSAPAWAPDGQTIAVTLSKDGNPEIYVVKVGTADFRRLTNHRGIDTDPTWSPTGRQIAFVSDRAGIPQIYIMDAEGTNVRRLTYEGGFNTQPRWSPRGDLIVYTSRQGGLFDLWAINPDGSNPRRLTTGQRDNESAAWAPHGRHLVFASNRTGRWQLHTMLADGSEQQQLTRDPGEAMNPSWSPRPQ